jgi:hypothetical protein
MKKSIVLPIFLFALYATAQEQESKPDLGKLYSKRLVSKIEFLVGPSVIYPYGGAWLKDIQVAKIGLAGSVGFIHVINSRLAINLKCGYGNKGQKLIINDDSDIRYNPPATIKSIFDITLNYATVSILPRYSFFKNREFYTGLGLYFGYLDYEKIFSELTINGTVVARSVSKPNPHLVYKEIDIGIESLVGYDIRMYKKINCSIQFLYNLGLMDVTKEGTYPLRNSTFSLLLGFSINKSNYVKP